MGYREKKMRVLEVNVDDVGLGGVYSLVRRVIRKKPDDMTIDIACIAHFEEEAHIKALAKYGTTVHYIGTDGPKITRPFQYKKNLVKLLEEEHYDVVHIHGDTAYLLRIFASAAKKAGVPKIILHSHAAGVDGKMRFLKSLLHKMLRRSLVLYGTEFVSCSDVASEWMFPNIDKEDIIKIHNGVSTAAFHFDPAVRERVRDELDVPDGTMLIGHVGRFNYQKNHTFILDVLAEMMVKKPHTTLLLIGKGPKEKEIKQDAAAYGLSRNIIFYGTTNKVNEMMMAMDAFILPSHFEGLPVVGVEAQAAGLPTFFSDQITEEAKIIDTVEFLPITKDAEVTWAERIRKRKVTDRKRSQGAARVKRAGFGIARTVKEFLALYTLDDIEDEEEMTARRRSAAKKAERSATAEAEGEVMTARRPAAKKAERSATAEAEDEVMTARRPAAKKAERSATAEAENEVMTARRPVAKKAERSATAEADEEEMTARRPAAKRAERSAAAEADEEEMTARRPAAKKAERSAAAEAEDEVMTARRPAAKKAERKAAAEPEEAWEEDAELPDEEDDSRKESFFSRLIGLFRKEEDEFFEDDEEEQDLEEGVARQKTEKHAATLDGEEITEEEELDSKRPKLKDFSSKISFLKSLVRGDDEEEFFEDDEELPESQESGGDESE